MKSLFKIGLLVLLVFSCKNNTEESTSLVNESPKTPAELIALAHGYDQWAKVTEIDFTFSVDRDTIKGAGRSWTWRPQQDSVFLKMPDQMVKYNRRNIDSISINADRAFINDKFWLLIPFQLVWDKGTSISEPSTSAAPISGTSLNMITLTYSNEGGYTPGDAYDIYYDDSYVIKEWTFRRGNDSIPTLSTTFEDYEDFNGLKIATSHKREDGSFNLKFRDVNVSMEQ